MVKQPTTEQSEFTMSSEDFPALPGTSTGAAPAQPPVHLLPDANHTPDKPRKGIQTSPEGNHSTMTYIYTFEIASDKFDRGLTISYNLTQPLMC